MCKYASISLGTVVSLPMRDGNTPQVERILGPVSVVSLPMRDGNRQSAPSIVLPCLVVSLPMRDGNNMELLKIQRKKRLLAYL